jgi:RHS repeat-associated protein
MSTPSVTFTYDDNGNTLTKVETSGTTSYGWDFENRLTSVTLPNSGGTVSFKYDPFGRRIQKWSTSGTTIYVYDGANIVAEYDSSGALIARYAQGQGIDQPLAITKQGTTAYYNADLGSITTLRDAGGALVASYTYEAFGKTTSTGTLVNPFQYTGREWDQETGLYYYRARYYDQTLGRFVSEDPIRFRGGIDFYKYAEDNPVMFKDPTGNDTYVCTAPLHSFGPIWGPLAYYTLPFVGFPTYHEYLCVWDGKEMVCGGQDVTAPSLSGALSGGPGKPSNDTAMERGGGCSVVNDQGCVDRCVIKTINNPSRPNYDLVNGSGLTGRRNDGQNCQKWADDTLQGCVQQCEGKR